MTQIAVFTGLDAAGNPTYRYEHPFNVFGNRRHRDYGDVQYMTVPIKGYPTRRRHVRITVQRHNVVEVSRKTGLPRTITSTAEAAPAETRQGRRARARYNAKWTRLHG